MSAKADSISLSLSSNNPSVELSNNRFGFTSLTASVTTTSSLTYHLSASAMLDTNNDPMTDLTGSGSDVIPTLDYSVTLPFSGSSFSDTTNFPTGRWGLGVEDNGAVVFKPITDNLLLKTETTNPSTADNTDIYFAVNPGSVDAGNYSTSIIISAVAALNTYEVDFNVGNGAGGPANHSYQTVDDTYVYTVPSTVPTRSEYEFLGWNRGSAIADLSRGDDASSLSLIQPGGTVTLTSASPSATLYAVWRATSGNTIEEVTNPDGSVTVTTTTYVNGEPTEKTIATTDTSGNVSTQEITYVNGEEVVTGYTIDTSGNPNGVLELDGTDSIDTGVIAFDGNDFTISLTAIFNMNDISGTANPVVAFRDYTDGGCMVNIHNSSVRWMNENNTSSPTTGTTLSFGFTRYTGGSSTSGSYYFRWLDKYNNYYWTYGTGTTEKQLKINIQNTSNVVSASIYNDSDTLVAQPATTTTLPMTFDFSSYNLDDITIVLGYFNNNGTDRYTKFDIVDFSVEKTLSSP